MLDGLRAEYVAQTMGPLITTRIRGLVEAMLRHRDPVIYARGAHDFHDGVDDVLHDFTIDVLLHEGQLAYIFDNAADVDGFDRLINYQLRRYLARTRQRTIVDNLLDRAIHLLEDDEQVTGDGAADSRSYRLATQPSDPPVRAPASSLSYAAAVAGNAVPKIYSAPDERNPKVYTDEGLRTLLRVFLSEYVSPVRKGDLEELLRLLLTPWVTSLLGLDEAVGDEYAQLTPEEEMLVMSVAGRVTATWSETDVVVFRCKLGNLPDSHLADRLGVSRPTAANAKKALFAALADELQDIDQHLRPAVIAAMARLTAEERS